MNRASLALLLTMLIGTLGVSLPAPAAAAGGTFYVDGKAGNDANSGASGSPLKTIARAASKVPAGTAGAGYTVVVRGYPDYIYRERPIPTGWGRTGTPGAPITFQAWGYAVGGSYVKPIVSGADPAPSAGRQWTATTTAGVWWTPWAVTPFDFGRNASSTLPTAVFQDVTTWLWEQRSLSALGSRAAKGLGGYWYDTAAKRLYVSAASGTGSASGTNPTGRKIDVIVRSAFLFDGRSGADHIHVRGFDVRHSANGIAWLFGADYGTAADNVLTGNLYMGISVTGYQTPAGPDPAVGMTLWRNRGSRNTIELIKLTSGVVNASVCYNDAWGNGLTGILVEGPPAGSAYTGTTSGITVCANKLHHHTHNPTGSAYNNAAGLLVQNGAQSVTIRDNQSYANDVGIHFTQGASGMRAMDGITMTRNRIWSNRRFGLYFFDGYRGSGAGRMTASHDLIWWNGIGVMVDRGVSNKTLSHETIHGNRLDGVKVGGYKVAKSSIAISESLITSNGNFGVWLVTGNSATLRYSGVSANVKGNLSGSVAKTAVNSQPAGYLSTTASSPDFLKITSTSYQYRAGIGGKPIGARY